MTHSQTKSYVAVPLYTMGGSIEQRSLGFRPENALGINSERLATSTTAGQRLDGNLSWTVEKKKWRPYRLPLVDGLCNVHPNLTSLTSRMYVVSDG